MALPCLSRYAIFTSNPFLVFPSFTAHAHSLSLSGSDPTARSWSFQSTWDWVFANLPKPRLWRFVAAHAAFAAKARFQDERIIALTTSETCKITHSFFTLACHTFPSRKFAMLLYLKQVRLYICLNTYFFMPIILSSDLDLRPSA
jgi:hypothetical protein